jgi:hypothetical protein
MNLLTLWSAFENWGGRVQAPEKWSGCPCRKHKWDLRFIGVFSYSGNTGNLQFLCGQYLFKSVNFADLCALYRISDAVIITSIRDGMNLVAQEYIACQKQKHGTLILSEFAGVVFQRYLIETFSRRTHWVALCWWILGTERKWQTQFTALWWCLKKIRSIGSHSCTTSLLATPVRNLSFWSQFDSLWLGWVFHQGPLHS